MAARFNPADAAPARGRMTHAPRRRRSGGVAIIQSGQNVSGAAVVVADRTTTKMASVTLVSDFPFTGTNPQDLDGAVVITVCSDGYLIYGLFKGGVIDRRTFPYEAMQSGG